VGANVRTASGYDEAFHYVPITENDSGFTPVYLSAAVTLQSPPGVDFDLCVRCTNCAGAEKCSITGGAGQTDTVTLYNDDDFGGDDTFYAFIEVR